MVKRHKRTLEEEEETRNVKIIKKNEKPNRKKTRTNKTQRKEKPQNNEK